MCRAATRRIPRVEARLIRKPQVLPIHRAETRRTSLARRATARMAEEVRISGKVLIRRGISGEAGSRLTKVDGIKAVAEAAGIRPGVGQGTVDSRHRRPRSSRIKPRLVLVGC